jgi:hypothetical protein
MVTNKKHLCKGQNGEIGAEADLKVRKKHV